MLFIDLKADIDLIFKFVQMTRDAGRDEDFQIFNLNSLSTSNTYNLIGNGTPTQIRDRIMQSLVWSEEFYRHQAGSFLLKVLVGLCYLRDANGHQIHIGDVFRVVNSKDEVRLLLTLIPRDERFIIQAVTEVVKFTSSESNWELLQGLRAQLESIVYSDFGKLVTSERPDIDLFKAVQSGKLVFLFLDTRRYGDTAMSVGRFILQDLKSVSSKIDADVLKTDRKPFSVIIDEFADLAQEDFIGFLDRARSSKMSIVVSHQEISDLKRISPEFAARLMGNTSTLYAFLQKGPESADLISNVAGTKTVTKRTYSNESTFGFTMRTGGFSEREAEEFIVHPNVIKSLPVGRCVVVKKYPVARAYVVDVESPT